MTRRSAGVSASSRGPSGPAARGARPGPLGLGEDWLRATWAGGAEDFDDPAQALLVRAVDELHDTSTPADETWAALRERYDDAELVELICLAGFYHLVAFVCRAFAVEPESYAAEPPA